MVWGCMVWDGVGYVCKIDGKMDADLYVSILDDDLQASLDFYGKTTADIIFQQDNDPSTLAGRPNLGFKTIILKFSYGLLNHQTLIPLNTFGVI